MTEKELLLRQVNQAFNVKSWHGTNLLGSIRGMKPEMAAWRPQPGRHNIWELIVHAAYWKYTVVRRLTGERRGSFALQGSNFFPRPEDPDDPSAAALKADIKLLKQYHQQLVAVIKSIKPSELNQISQGSSIANRDVIIGIAAHDVYHAGQIQLIKRQYTDAMMRS